MRAKIEEGKFEIDKNKIYSGINTDELAVVSIERILNTGIYSNYS